MIRFKKYLAEKKEAAKTGTLNVFDIDETLFRTFAKIRVMKDGKLVRELTNQELNNYKLQPGEKYDFAEFRNAKTFKETSQPIERMFSRAKAVISGQDEHSKTILLTARADFDDKDMFLQTFRDHGFPIDDTHVHRAGNLSKIKPDVSTAVAKMTFLRKYINSGKYNKIRVWDDSTKNLNAIAKLIQMHPNIKIETYLVHHDGSTTRHT